MSYTPTEWETADIVTAQRMNALETAVGDMNMSYTPNTWSDGDILSAAKMNALEQAVASGGGGGSSDFSMAEVTIVNETADSLFLGNVIVCFEENETGLSSPPFIGNEAPLVPAQGNKTFNVPLYKGMAIWFNADITAQGTASGAIVLDDDTGMVYITGNGTITIS